MFVAVAGPSVAVVAVGGVCVALLAVSNGTRTPAACCTGRALDFARRFGQNAASIDAGTFDAGCFESSAVLS